MSMADVPRKCYRCKLVLLGDSGTGKTTFQRCVSQSVLRTLPDVPPSVSSSSSLYYYRSTTKREKLDMLLVDGGPRGFITASTLGHIFHQTNFFILVMSLAGVKQRTSKRFLSFGNEPSAIVHAQDKAMIRSYITSIMAASPPTMRTPRLAIVGTHKDFLTDQSREAVETVLREINRVVTDVTQGMTRSPLYTGSFAVSCTDHSCVPENRGGPRSIAELWAFICDLSLKEAVQVRAVVGDAALRVEELCERAAFHIPDDTTYTMRPIPFTARNSELNHATERMVTFIRRAKTELNFVIVHVRALRQVAFSLGIFSNDHLDAVLQMLSRDGEVLWLRHQPHHIGGREESVLLWPHLAHRAVVALTTYHEAAGAWPSNHHLFPGIDAEECHKADPERRAADGIFPPSLVVALSKALPQARRPVVERAETFALLLILTDFVFQRRCRRRPLPSMIKSPSTAAIDGRSVTPPPVADDLDVLMGGRSPAARGPPSSSGPPTLANHSTAPTSSHPPVSSTRRTLVEYIAPCLIRHDLPYTTQSYFTDSILHAPRNGLLLGSFAAISLLRTIKILHCPPTAFQRLMCRWAPYIVPGSAVYRNAVYLQRSCGGEETPYKDDHDTIDSDEDDGHDAGSQGPYSVGSPLRATRHTRCLVLADLVSADDKGIAASTPLSGSLHVRFVVVSSEDLLIVAHFINSLLRASCQALDAFYPNVEWSVEGEPFNHHHPTTTHKEGDGGGRTEVVDIPTVDDLDAMFDAESAAL